MTDEVRFWLVFAYAPAVALGGWLIKVAITQSQHNDRLKRIEEDVEKIESHQGKVVEMLTEVRLLCVTMGEQLKTLFEDRKRGS